jgi:hypothetical protein
MTQKENAAIARRYKNPPPYSTLLTSGYEIWAGCITT